MSGTPVLYVHWGDEGIRGSERVLLDLLSLLDRDRYRPFLWCNARPLGAAARELDVPVEISDMPILLGWDSPKVDIKSYRRLVNRGLQLIRSHGARLVHANSGAPNQWMVPAARQARVPLVAHLHAVYKFRERCTLLLHQAPMVVGCSAAVLEPFRKDHFPEQRMRVIHNGVDPTRLNRGSAAGMRESLGLGPDSILAVCAGALVPLKRFDIVIRSLKIAAQRGLDVHLAIAGEGPALTRLEAIRDELDLVNRVHFLGQISDIGAVFRDAADIAVIASDIESFGLIAAEAGAMGRPTIATRVGGIPELINDGATGLLVSSGDVNELADALTRLGASGELRRRIGSAARDHVLAQLTTDRMTRSFEALYAELLAIPASAFGWTRLRFRVAPFARLGLEVIGRRLGASATEI